MSETLRKNKELRAQAIELPPRTLPYWSVQEVRTALDEHEQGMLQSSALLAEAMDRDDRVKAVLDTRIQGLLGLPFSFAPADDSVKAKRACALIKEQWSEWFPMGDLAQLLRWGIVEGVGLGELIYSTKDGLLLPRLKVWHPQYLYWRWDLHDWFGGWQLITQTGAVEPLPGDGKWLVLQPGGLRRPWMSGLVRSISRPYLMRGYAYRDWASWSEVNGSGIKKATVPSQASEQEKNDFFHSLTKLGSHGVLILPQSKASGQETQFDLQILEASSGGDGFEKLISETDQSIAIAVLGQNLSTSVGGASLAAAQVHNDVRHDIMAADAAMMCGAIRSQVLKPWCALNFGDEALAPTVRIEVDPPEDQQKKAQTLQAFAQAIAALQQAKVPVDFEKLLESAGIPLKEENAAI